MTVKLMFDENGIVSVGLSKNVDCRFKFLYIFSAAIAFQEDSVDVVYIDFRICI